MVNCVFIIKPFNTYYTDIPSPRTVVVSSTELIVNWFPPSLPNGVVTEYRLQKKVSTSSQWDELYNGMALTYTDSALTAGQTYFYRVEVSH